MINIYRLLIIFMLCPAVYAQQYNTYILEQINKLAVGTSENELNIFQGSIGYSGPKGPGGLSFDDDGNLLINDTINYKIKIFTPSYDIKSVVYTNFNEFDTLNATSLMKHGDKLLGYWRDEFYVQLSSNGDTEVRLRLPDLSYYHEITNCILLGKTAFFWKKDGSLFSIPNPGPDPEANNRKILNASQTLELFNEPAKYGLEGVTLKNGKLFVDGVLQTRDYEVFIKYWMEKHSISSFDTYRNSTMHFYKPLHYVSTGMSYLGEDEHGNAYWNNSAVNYVIVFNKGKCIETIKYDQTKSKTSPSVHPSGDIYFLGYDSDAVYLYRIKNVWDARGRETWYALHGGEPGAEQLSTKIGLLNDSRVRFRTEPNLTSETLGFLNKGDRVLVLEQSTDKMQIGDMNDYWYRIRTAEGTEGWAYGAFIDVE